MSVNQVKISELGKVASVRENDVVPLNNTTKGGKPITRGATMSDIRTNLLFGNAYGTVQEALEDVENNQTFFVYTSSDKSVVNYYLKLNGVATPVVDDNGVPKQYATEFGSLKVAKIGDETGFSSIGGVDSFDRLRNVKPSSAGQKVILKGYVDGSEIGGGVFESVMAYDVDDNGVVCSKPGNSFHWRRVVDNDVTPEMFGAVGDRSVDDTVPLTNIIRYAQINGTDTKPVIINLRGKYSANKAIDVGSNTHLKGPGEIYIDSDDLTLTFLKVIGRSNVRIEGLSITRKVDKPATMWSKGATCIQAQGCSYLYILDNDLSFHTDAISVSNSNRVYIERNRTHNLGEEGIAIRSSRNFIVRGNHIFNHHGDGILMKTGNIVCNDGQIVGNFLYDGLIDPVAAVGQRGGGITLNDENVNGAGGSTTVYDGLLVQGNILRNLSYGIAFTNLTSAGIHNNIITDVTRFGLVIDTAVFNNPALHPVLRFSVTGNILKNVGERGIGFRSANGIIVDNVTIANNVLDNCGYKTASEYPAIDLDGGIATGNVVTTSNVAIQASGSAIVSNNQFLGSIRATSSAASNWIKLSGAVSFTNNIVKDTNFGHIRMTGLSGSVIVGNKVELNSVYASILFTTTAASFGNNVFDNNYYNVKTATVCNFMIGADSIRALGLGRAELNYNDYSYDPFESSLIKYKKGDTISWNPRPGGISKYHYTDDAGTRVAAEFVPYYATSNALTVSVPANGVSVVTIADTTVKGTWATGKIWCSVTRNGLMLQADCVKDGTVQLRLVNTTAAVIALTAAIVKIECFSPPE